MDKRFLPIFAYSETYAYNNSLVFPDNNSYTFKSIPDRLTPDCKYTLLSGDSVGPIFLYPGNQVIHTYYTGYKYLIKYKTSAPAKFSRIANGFHTVYQTLDTCGNIFEVNGEGCRIIYGVYFPMVVEIAKGETIELNISPIPYKVDPFIQGNFNVNGDNIYDNISIMGLTQRIINPIHREFYGRFRDRYLTYKSHRRVYNLNKVPGSQDFTINSHETINNYSYNNTGITLCLTSEQKGLFQTSDYPKIDGYFSIFPKVSGTYTVNYEITCDSARPICNRFQFMILENGTTPVFNSITVSGTTGVNLRVGNSYTFVLFGTTFVNSLDGFISIRL